jgi:hypothetical protein
MGCGIYKPKFDQEFVKIIEIDLPREATYNFSISSKCYVAKKGHRGGAYKK